MQNSDAVGIGKRQRTFSNLWLQFSKGINRANSLAGEAMAVSISRFLCLILAVLIAVGMSNSGQRVEAQTCNTDIMDLVGKCRKFVGKSGSKVSPSSGCCNLVKDFDVPCLCSLLTQEIEDIISMDKVVYVARSCGKKISTRTKCGSYTIPAA